jgi:uncharacterized membrane protein (DUF485 family)
MKFMVKHSTFIFGFIAAFGLAILTFFLTAVYLARTLSSEILTIEAIVPSSILGNFWVLFLIFGTGFLTIGVMGIGRQRIKNKKTLFTALTAILTPIIVFTLFLSTLLATTYPTLNDPPERMSLTNVSVIATNPLTLSLNAKSFYMTEIYFDRAYIKDPDQTTVASIIGKEVEVQKPNSSPYWTFQFVARLPAASEKALTLNFNTTLPSGEYSVWLHSYRQQTFTTLYFNLP